MKKIYLIGIGPGDKEYLTGKAKKYIDEADTIIGSKRVFESIPELLERQHLISYQKEEIINYIFRNDDFEKSVILLTGDTGFYSGAKGIIECLEKLKGKKSKQVESQSENNNKQCETEMIIEPGISSVIYLADKIGISWQDAVFTSCHGTHQSPVNTILHNEKTFVLIGKGEDASRIGKELLEYGRNQMEVWCGEKLSYEEEKIRHGKIKDCVEWVTDSLSVLFFYNPEAKTYYVNDEICNPYPGSSIPDEFFIRGKSPMTKEEVRTISVAKLHLPEDAICYDIGSGTGSVSVQMALLCPKGKVYSIERFPEGLELTKRNALKFGCANIEVVAGMAPECLKELPAPSHVFIGGSGGELLDIIETIHAKNCEARFVLTAVTLETISQLKQIQEMYPEYENMEITQLFVSRGKALGSYQMLQAENPIMIATWGGEHR